MRDEAELLARIEANVARDPRDVALRTGDLVRVFGERARGISPESLRASAVLVPIVLRAGGATLLLTRRASGVPVRGGDIVFPGGGVRGEESLVETALPEAEEEVGVPAGRTRALGFLDAHPTLIGFWIQPVVALVPGDFTPRPNPREVDAFYELPLASALDLSRHRRVRVTFDGGEHEVQNFEHDGVALWGVSAAIVHDLAERAGSA
ncbi:MAG: CoA pyrophosphatase [Deltaproteobacteria bacterium]|nr:CoA pyrophosphatase [Deltaproteobacteria bacterium]